MKTMAIQNIPYKVADYISKRAALEGRCQNIITITLLNEAADFIPKHPRKIVGAIAVL